MTSIVLMGNGDGTFHAVGADPGRARPRSRSPGRLRAQRPLDLAVADISSGDVTILSNQGGGSFSATQTIQLPGRQPLRHRSWRATSAPATSTWP